MNNLEGKINKDAQRVHLTQSEKQTMKSRVLAIPISEPKPIHAFNFIDFFSNKKVVAFAMVALFILAGVPFTHAAQKSGPGEVLYSFELNIVEPLEHFVQFFSNSQIAYSSDRLEERLNELQSTLRSEITNEDIAVATDNIQQHVDDALIAASESSSADEVEHLIAISALLNAHEDILNESGQEASSVEALNDEVEQDLSDKLNEYSKEQTSSELSVVVNQELTETNQLIQNGLNDPDNADVIAGLQDARKDIRTGNFTDALQEIIDAKVQALAQDYINQNN